MLTGSDISGGINLSRAWVQLPTLPQESLPTIAPEFNRNVSGECPSLWLRDEA